MRTGLNNVLRRYGLQVIDKIKYDTWGLFQYKDHLSTYRDSPYKNRRGHMKVVCWGLSNNFLNILNSIEAKFKDNFRNYSPRNFLAEPDMVLLAFLWVTKLVVLKHCGLVTSYGDKKSRSTLDQVMDWCLMAPSHYLIPCWLFIREVLLHSPPMWKKTWSG